MVFSYIQTSLSEVESNKIVDGQTLATKIAEQQFEGVKFVVVEGCFDILHKGHFRAFESAKHIAAVESGNQIETIKLVVRVHSDECIKKRPEKDPRGSILSAYERMLNISHISHVDFVTEKSEIDFRWLQDLNPDFVVRSTTTGGNLNTVDVVSLMKSFVVEQKLCTKILIIDKEHSVITESDARQAFEDFKLLKHSGNHVSSSSIKKEVAKRAIDDFVADLPTSLIEYVERRYEEMLPHWRSASKSIGLKCQDLVEPIKGCIFISNQEFSIKEKTRWVEKVLKKYDGRIQRITDSCRGVVVASDIRTTYRLLENLQTLFRCSSIDDYFSCPAQLGSRGIVVNIECEDVCYELQIHTYRSFFAWSESDTEVQSILPNNLYRYLRNTLGLEVGFNHSAYRRFRSLKYEAGTLEAAEELVSLFKVTREQHNLLYAEGL
jgi:glycerol-3-phosphate cytidylyltransferase-like family protein